MPQAWKTTGPGGWVIQMSASDSTHLAFVIGREQAQGTTDDKVLCASNQSNSSIEKGRQDRRLPAYPADRLRRAVRPQRRGAATDGRGRSCCGPGSYGGGVQHRHDGYHAHRSGAGRSVRSPGSRHVAPRRCRLRRDRDDLPRVPPPPVRLGAGRLVHVQPTQVDVYRPSHAHARRPAAGGFPRTRFPRRVRPNPEHCMGAETPQTGRRYSRTIEGRNPETHIRLAFNEIPTTSTNTTI